MRPASPSEAVYVAGAGPGGLSLALRLARAGGPVQVLERAPAPRDGGGALVLWPNGARPLIRLLGEHALEGDAVAYERARVRTWSGALLQDLPVGAHGRRYGGPVLALGRGALMRRLLEALPSDRVRFGAGVVGYQRDGDGVEVLLEDGERLRGRALVGADGVHSRIGEQMDGARGLRASGVTIWMGELPAGAGRRGGGTLCSTVGRGLRFLDLPRPDGGAWWLAYVDDALGVQSLTDLRRAFRGWHSPILDRIDGTDPDALIVTPIRDRTPRARWVDGPVVLLGDAAHVCTPDLGQGACLALEDAEILGDLLSSEVSPEALSGYARTRAGRVALIQAASRALTDLTTARGGASCAVRDTLFAATSPIALLAGFGWLFREPSA